MTLSTEATGLAGHVAGVELVTRSEAERRPRFATREVIAVDVTG
jgi:hypothetical protein